MGERRFTDKYDDIIHMPHHVSKRRQPMSLYERAAQFSPFAALTGHGEAVKETARLTGERVELDEYEKEILRGRLQYLIGCTEAWNAAGRPVEERPEVMITWFVPDLLKAGGKYVTAGGQVKKFDHYLHQIVMIKQDDGDGPESLEIRTDDILQVEGELFGAEFGFE